MRNKKRDTGYGIQNTGNGIRVAGYVFPVSRFPLPASRFPFPISRSPLLKGFTLIELLVSISILSIVMLAVYSSFALGVNTYQKFGRVNLKERRVVLNLEKIGDELRQCSKYPDIGFKGDKEKLFFPIVIDDQIAKISYIFDSDKKILYRQQQTQKEILELEKGSSEEESPFKEFLFPVEDLNLSYYYFDEQEEEYRWVDSYEENLPLSIKIKLTFEDEVFAKTVSLPCAY